MAYLLIRGSDQAKYSTLKKGTEYQFSLDNDQYPNTIVAEVDALNNHKCYIKHCEIQKWDQYHSLPE